MVPNGWKLERVGDLFDVQLGKMLNQEAKDKTPQFHYLGNSNVKWGSFDLSDLKTMHFSERDVEKFTLELDDIIMCEGGEVGRCAIWQGSDTAIFYQKALHRLRSKGQIIPQFFQSYMEKISGTKLLDDYTTRTSIAHLTREKLISLPVRLPPIPEQKEIANILSTWDKAISTTEQLLANSQQLKKALMQQLLTGKKRLLDNNGVRFSGEWNWLKACELFKTISRKNNSETEELLAVTQDQGVLPRSMLERRVVMPDGSTLGYKLVVPGNFIISLRSFQGGLEYSSYRGLVSPAYTVLEPIRLIDDEFYKQYYKSYDFIGHLAVAVIGIRDGKQISYEDFSFLKLPYPSLEEQQKIAAVLSTADKEITALQQKLDALKQEKKALMQQLLTGKRRVKVEVAA